jgi:PIN domain nuclease of toxin-antitoxin system
VKILLDTHIFLWFVGGDPALSAGSRAAVESPENERLLSIASVWEMAIKVSLGKLTLPADFGSFMATQMADSDIGLLGVEMTHTNIVVGLPFHHRDPFDRLLIAQAIAEQIPIVSQDRLFDAYPVTCIR